MGSARRGPRGRVRIDVYKRQVQGIVAVEVDVSTKTVRIEYETEQALANAKELLAEIGYPVIAN